MLVYNVTILGMARDARSLARGGKSVVMERSQGLQNQGLNGLFMTS